ncbi:MAG TPA: DUF5330 domain-containing protein [Rhizobiaceae bacterium]|nr:DUF5330 domain-containing protein [Rhizobiaceae bacterium]
MGFLIRLGFWFSLVLLILPLGTMGDGENAPSVGPLQAFFAARDAVGDVAGICERKPEVCEVGKAALQTIGARARIAYEFIDGQFDEPDQSVATGSIAIDDGSPDMTNDGAAPGQHAHSAVPIPSRRPQN